MANTSTPQPENSDHTNENQNTYDETNNGEPESFHRLADLLAEVSTELDRVSTHLRHDGSRDPASRTPDPPPVAPAALAGGEPVDTSFSPAQTPVATAAGVSRFGGPVRWPGWFAGAAAMCGAALLLMTAATGPGLLAPAQVVGGFALGAGLLGIWASRS